MDDTDLSTRANSEPVYDFLAQHGFWGTKTVWPSRAKRISAFRRPLEREPDGDTGSTLEDPDYVDFVLKLKALGFEIALHGNAAGNSLRPEIVRGLEHFRTVVGTAPTLNAFHQTNIENLYCGRDKLDAKLLRLIERFKDRSEYEGHVEGAPSFWGDIARDTFRYVRLPFHTIDEVNTLKVNPSMPFTDARRPFVRRWFASSDGSDVLRFSRLLSAANVRRLATERGICIIYTHFAKRFARPIAGRYLLDSDFMATVARVSGDSRAWFAGASTMLDRLRAARSMRISHSGHELLIENRGDVAFDDLVVELPRGMQLKDSDGSILNHTDDAAVLPRLEPNETVRLETNIAGNQLSTPPEPEIPPRERLRLEYSNYGGLVRGMLSDRLFYTKRRWLART